MRNLLLVLGLAVGLVGCGRLHTGEDGQTVFVGIGGETVLQKGPVVTDRSFILGAWIDSDRVNSGFGVGLRKRKVSHWDRGCRLLVVVETNEQHDAVKALFETLNEEGIAPCIDGP